MKRPPSRRAFCLAMGDGLIEPVDLVLAMQHIDLVALVTTDEQRDVAIATSERLEEGATREHAAERVTVGKHDIVFECR